MPPSQLDYQQLLRDAIHWGPTRLTDREEVVDDAQKGVGQLALRADIGGVYYPVQAANITVDSAAQAYG